MKNRRSRAEWKENLNTAMNTISCEKIVKAYREPDVSSEETAYHCCTQQKNLFETLSWKLSLEKYTLCQITMKSLWLFIHRSNQLLRY